MSKEKEAKMAAHNIYFENTGKPKETVIARGKVEKRDTVPAYWIGETPLVLLLGEPLRKIAHKKQGKTIEITIREVKDE